jgi:hypothetical protein
MNNSRHQVPCWAWTRWAAACLTTASSHQREGQASWTELRMPKELGGENAAVNGLSDTVTHGVHALAHTHTRTHTHTHAHAHAHSYSGTFIKMFRGEKMQGGWGGGEGVRCGRGRQQKTMGGGLGRAGQIREQQQQQLRDQPRGCRRSCLAGRRGGEGCSNSSPLSWAPGVAQRQQRAQLPACRQLQRRKRGVTSKAEGEGEGGGKEGSQASPSERCSSLALRSMNSSSTPWFVQDEAAVATSQKQRHTPGSSWPTSRTAWRPATQQSPAPAQSTPRGGWKGRTCCTRRQSANRCPGQSAALRPSPSASRSWSCPSCQTREWRRQLLGNKF